MCRSGIIKELLKKEGLRFLFISIVTTIICSIFYGSVNFYAGKILEMNNNNVYVYNNIYVFAIMIVIFGLFIFYILEQLIVYGFDKKKIIVTSIFIILFIVGGVLVNISNNITITENEIVYKTMFVKDKRYGYNEIDNVKISFVKRKDVSDISYVISLNDGRTFDLSDIYLKKDIYNEMIQIDSRIYSQKDIDMENYEYFEKKSLVNGLLDNR